MALTIKQPFEMPIAWHTRRRAAMAALLLFCHNNFAAGAESGSPPWPELLGQALNFAPFALLLYFFAARPLRSFFKNQREEFLSAEAKALAALSDKERAFQKEKQRLEDIEKEALRAGDKALKEGARFQAAKALELKEMEAFLERRKALTLRLAQESAFQKTRSQLKKELLRQTRHELAKKGDGFHKKAPIGFIKRIEDQKLLGQKMAAGGRKPGGKISSSSAQSGPL